jgi:hypothetical protein
VLFAMTGAFCVNIAELWGVVAIGVLTVASEVDHIWRFMLCAKHAPAHVSRAIRWCGVASFGLAFATTELYCTGFGVLAASLITMKFVADCFGASWEAAIFLC